MSDADIMLQVIRVKYASRIILLAAFAILFAACGANEGILKSGKDTPSSSNIQPGKSSFDQDLDSMRTADFRFVYVLRRKDGGVIDAEDKSVIKLQTVDMNRRVASDNDKAFIISSNAMLPPKNMRALLEHFSVENYSPPLDANANANTKK